MEGTRSTPEGRRPLQRRAFGSGEGDAWYRRNREALSAAGRDPVLDALRELDVEPRRVLEVGCSNGHRLNRLREAFGSECHGLDPSSEAVADGAAAFPELRLQVGTAESLPYGDGTFDLLLFGFCLYLADRVDLFRIAAEADRVLRDEGLLGIVDFYPPFPYSNPYRHREGIYSFKLRYADMFLWNPWYEDLYLKVFADGGAVRTAEPDELSAVQVLRKRISAAYPERPFPTPMDEKGRE